MSSLVYVHSESFPSYLKFVETLALVCHVPINERQTSRGEVYTALDLLVHMTLTCPRMLDNREDVTSLLLKLLANDGEITKLPFRNPAYPYGNAAHLLLPRVVNELCPQGMNTYLVDHLLSP